MTTPDDLADLPTGAPDVIARRVPEFADVYARRGWRMFPSIDRVYVNTRARHELGWQPKYDFSRVIEALRTSDDFRSPLSRAIGSKGYNRGRSADGGRPHCDA